MEKVQVAYTPMELFEELKHDESWGKDQETREMLVTILFKILRDA